MKRLRIALTGGIACGKSLVAKYLNELGVATVDADDIVHGLIPDPAERRRIAAEVFADPEKRRELEARIHPLVQAELDRRFSMTVPPLVEIIPLLFETHWDQKYGIICAVVSTRANQIDRMIATRGYTREAAEARLAAQMPTEAKAEKSHYVICNDGSAEELKSAVATFADWLKRTIGRE